MDHVIYKQRAYVLVGEAGNDEFKKAVSVDHHDCRLGKWYEGEGKEVFGASPSYRALLAPHSKVHECVHSMVEQLDQGWERDLAIQDKIYNALEGTEKASMEVMHLIDQIIVDKHPGMAKIK